MPAHPVDLSNHSSEPEAVSEEARAAFEYTCQYYLNISGEEFLRRYDSGEIDLTNPTTAEERVIGMMAFAR